MLKGRSPILGVDARSPWAKGADLWYDFTKKANGITDTHADTIYAARADGLYLPYAANVLTRDSNGLQTIPTRTNSIRNNSNTGASAPSTLPTNWAIFGGTGLSVTYAFGTQNGLPYIDLIVSGTTGDGNGVSIRPETTTQIAATNTQTWSQSASLSLVAGSLTNVNSVQLLLIQRDAGGAFLSTLASSDFKSSIVAEPVRLSAALTTNNASIAYQQPAIVVNASSGVAVNYTLRIAAIQSEVGAFASAPIITTTVAVTVNGNQPVISGLGTQLAVGVAGIVQFVLPGGPLNSSRIFEFDDGSGTNRAFGVADTAAISVQMTAAGVAQGIVVPLGIPATAGTLYTLAFSFSTDYINARLVGQAAVSADVLATWPVMDRLQIAGGDGNAGRNSYQSTKKLALKFGPQNATTFDEWYQKALTA